MTPTRVLVPLDGSPLAEEALAHALETFDCPVTVLNVVTPLDSAMSEGGVLGGAMNDSEFPGSDDSRREAAHEHAVELVETARQGVAESDRRLETVVKAGDPAETILAYVEDHDVEHVVMGGHGGPRSELASRLLGTVATRVVSEAPVTVTVVR